MQTFLPFPNYRASAKALDRLRLGKQRSETLIILKTLLTGEGGWINHPAVRMWRGHERQLLRYQIMICTEWSRRGYRDTCLEKSFLLYDATTPEQRRALIYINHRVPPNPPWLGDPEFHRSHQSNLIRKNPEFYGPKFPGIPPDLKYVWPV